MNKLSSVEKNITEISFKNKNNPCMDIFFFFWK